MDKGKDNDKDKDVEMKDSTKDNNKKDDEKAKEEEKKKKEEELNNFIEMKVAEVQDLPIDQIKQKVKALEAQTSSLKGDINKMKVDIKKFNARIKENKSKLQITTGLPHLVSTISEIFDIENMEQDDEGSGLKHSENTKKNSKGAIIKTSTRATIFLPSIGFVEPEELKPLELVGVNKDTYLIYEKLPTEYDSRVRVMELDTKPTEKYSDMGGVDKQIQELEEAIVFPLEKKHLFEAIGIKPPKGVLMFGPPGTGKTMLARAVAARVKATFLKLAGSQLVQAYIGDGAKMVRDAFALAREKAPTIVFIDEIDAVGLKRSGGDGHGGQEVQRTMLELLNQLDGFSSTDDVKVIAATNRADVLDPALLRSGRLDRKIEFPMPNEEGRAKILEIHSRKMHYNNKMVNFKEFARMTDDFNGAMLKAVCVEAGMIALRRGGTEVSHNDYVEGINQVKAKKKAKLYYYS
jgi:26S proteasome regulatory subunit T5